MHAHPRIMVFTTNILFQQCKGNLNSKDFCENQTKFRPSDIKAVTGSWGLGLGVQRHAQTFSEIGNSGMGCRVRDFPKDLGAVLAQVKISSY